MMLSPFVRFEQKKFDLVGSDDDRIDLINTHINHIQDDLLQLYHLGVIADKKIITNLVSIFNPKLCNTEEKLCSYDESAEFIYTQIKKNLFKILELNPRTITRALTFIESMDLDLNDNEVEILFEFLTHALYKGMKRTVYDKYINILGIMLSKMDSNLLSLAQQSGKSKEQ